MPILQTESLKIDDPSDVAVKLEAVLEDRRLLGDLMDIVRSRWYPRVRDAAVRYCLGKPDLVSRNFLIYGAGSHTLSMLEDPRFDALRSNIIGCLDKRAEEMVKVGSYPVDLLPTSAALEYRGVPILASHHEYERNMVRELIDMGVDRERIHTIYDQPGYGALLDTSIFDKRLCEIVSRTAGLKRMLIVSARPTAIVPRDIWKELSGESVVIHLDMTRTGVDQCATDYHLDCRQSVQQMLKAIDALSPELVYVYDQYSTCNVSSYLIKVIRQECPVILEMYDSIALTFDVPEALEEAGFWRREEINVATWMESDGIQYYDGVVHKDRGMAFERFVDDTTTPLLSYQPFVSEEEFAFVERTSICDPPRLVWAGAINPTSNPSKLFGDNQFAPILEKLIGQDIAVDLYTGHYRASDIAAELPDYVSLSQKSRLLKIHLRMARGDLIQEIANKYDFGMIIGSPPEGHYRHKGLSATFSSKFLTYLVAGLPVVVSSVFEYMAELVDAWGVGIVIDDVQIEKLKKYLIASDYTSMKHSVKLIQPRISSQYNVPIMKEFIQSVNDRNRDAVRLDAIERIMKNHRDL